MDAKVADFFEKWLENGAVLLSEGSDQVHLGLGPFTAVEKPERNQPLWYWGPFFELPEGGKVPSDYRVFTKNQLLTQLFEFKNSEDTERGKPWKSPSVQEFQTDFSQIQDLIGRGKLKKVVPVVFESQSTQVTKSILAQMLEALLTGSTRGNLFGHWDLSQGKGLLGLTPEVLFHHQGLKLNTMALAGTAQNSEHDLLKDNKELQEHQFVASHLKHTLKSFGVVESHGPYEFSPGALRHLRTDFRVQLESPLLTLFPLLSQLHPTPALGGEPKEVAWEWLKSQSPQRGEFGAPFGLWMGEESQFVVAIRCVIWENGELKVGSGCGIVKDSQVDREWSELQRKRQSVKAMLGIE